MEAAKRLADCLAQGGKVEGLREPIWCADGSLHSYAANLINIDAGDLAETTTACGGKNHPSQIVRDLHQGATHPLNNGRKVVVEVDRLYHLLRQVPAAPEISSSS